MRTIKKIHQAVNAPIDDLITYRALPTTSIDHIDPFLFLNHHGPQYYKPDNTGLPFGPHPHRGFETLTFIFKGDLVHWDTGNGKYTISEGGIQWMTAGSGIIHSEISSDEFKKNGGEVEIIQIWLNLPSGLKMIEPKYTGLQKDKIPVIELDNKNIRIKIISGNFEGHTGPVISLTNISIAEVIIKKGSTYKTNISLENNILLYLVSGSIEVNKQRAAIYNLIEFNNDNESISIKALKESVLIFGYGKPFNEPIIAQGPFVMNTPGEIKQAYLDYQSGKMGRWEE